MRKNKQPQIDGLSAEVATAMVRANAAGVSTSDTISSFVLAPDYPGVLPPNVFRTEGALKAALLVTRGVRTIGMDSTYAAITLSGGVYSAENDIDVVGLSDFETPITVTGPIEGIRSWVGISWTYTGVTPMVALAAGEVRYMAVDTVAVTAATAALFDASAAGSFLAITWGVAGFANAPANIPAFSTSAAGYIEIFVGPNATIDSNTIAGPVGSIWVTMQSSSLSFFSRTQSGVTGGTIVPTIAPVAPASQTQAFVVLNLASSTPPTAGILQTTFGNSGAELLKLAAATQAALLANIPKTIYFYTDPATTTFTAGSYAFNGKTTFATDGDPIAIAIDAGVTWTGVFNLEDLVITSACAAGGVIESTLGPGVSAVQRVKNCQITQTGAGAFFQLSPENNSPNLYLSENTAFMSTSGPVVHTIAGAGGSQSLEIWVDGTSSIATNTLSADVGTSIFVHVAPGGSCSPTQLGAGTITIVYEATPSVTVAQQAAQGAALTGDLFNPGGPGVSFTARTTSAIVSWTSTGQADLVTRQFQFALTCSGGAVVNGSAVQRASPGGDSGSTVSCAGLVSLTGLTPGTSYTVRVQWAISGGAGTYTSDNTGTLVIHEPK